MSAGSQCYLHQSGLSFRSEVMSYYTQCLQVQQEQLSSCTTCSLPHALLVCSASLQCRQAQRRGGHTVKRVDSLGPRLQSCSSGPRHLRKFVSIPRLQIPLHFRHELIQRGCQVGLLLVLQTEMSQVKSVRVQHAMSIMPCLDSIKTGQQSPQMHPSGPTDILRVQLAAAKSMCQAQHMKRRPPAEFPGPQ